LVTIENITDQLAIYRQILSEELSVRKTEQLVRDLGQSKKEIKESKEKEKEAKPAANYEIQNLQTKLSSHFGTKINIKADGNKGEIRIPYISTEDLNRILDILDM
jgi:ParB family transcriptional regulator, chromosome partitioning protein